MQETNRATAPIFKIYFMKALTDTEKTEKLFPEERQAEVDEAKTPKTRAEKYSVWKLLQHALQHAFGVAMEELSFQKDDFGKWTCDKFFFSLSHSNGVACVAVSDATVGVDLENVCSFEKKFGHKLNALFGKCLCKGESVPQFLTVPAAVTLWTQKESIFKLRGKGKFVPSQISAEKTSVTVFKQIFGEEWCVSFCGEHSFAAEFFVVDGNGNVIG